MTKHNEVYERAYKYCEVCEKKTAHIIEATVSVCSKCNETTDSDAEDLFGAIE